MHKNIIIINPGVYRPYSDHYQARYKALSENFKGYIFTASPIKEKISIGRFTFLSTQLGNGLWPACKFAFFCWRNTLKLFHRGIKIDLIAAYDPLKTGLCGFLTSRILKARLAVEVNGVYTSAAQDTDKVCRRFARAKRFIYMQIMRFVLKKADGIKLLHDHQIDCFKDILQGKIIRVFPNYVAVKKFSNIREEKEVLFAGFPFKLKGVDILIKAFKKIASKHQDWKLKILGWFPDLRELKTAIGSHPQIYHHPPVHTFEMPEHIGTCGIFVLPSRSEAMGRVLVEAMAAGKARIGTNVDGIPGVINDGIDGLLVEPENVDNLANKLDLLMGDPTLRHRLGSAGQIRSKKEFAEEIYIRNLVNYYNDVLMD